MKGQRSPEVFASTKINGARDACKYQNQRAEGQHRTQGALPKQNCRGLPEKQPEPKQKKVNLTHANETDALALEVLTKPKL